MNVIERLEEMKSEELVRIQQIPALSDEFIMKYGNLEVPQLVELYRLEGQDIERTNDEAMQHLYDLYLLDESIEYDEAEPQGRFAYTNEQAPLEKLNDVDRFLRTIQQRQLRMTEARGIRLEQLLVELEAIRSSRHLIDRPMIPADVQFALNQQAQRDELRGALLTHFRDDPIVAEARRMHEQQRFLDMNPPDSMDRYPMLSAIFPRHPFLSTLPEQFEKTKAVYEVLTKKPKKNAEEKIAIPQLAEKLRDFETIQEEWKEMSPFDLLRMYSTGTFEPMDAVTVTPVMNSDELLAFLEQLEQGGTFVYPLDPSPLYFKI